MVFRAYSWALGSRITAGCTQGTIWDVRSREPDKLSIHLLYYLSVPTVFFSYISAHQACWYQVEITEGHCVWGKKPTTKRFKIQREKKLQLFLVLPPSMISQA